MSRPNTEDRWKYEPRLRRSLIDRMWAPWNAVRSATYLDEWLRSRFACYLAQLPQRRTDPSFGVDVRGTEIVKLDETMLAVHPPTTGVVVAIEREVELARAAELEVQACVTSAAAAVEQAERRLAEAIADGSVHPRGRSSVRAARPTMPPRWPMMLVAGLLVALAGCEALMVAFPFWDAIGVDTRHLWTEVRAQLAGVVGGAGFAVAAVLGLIGASERLRDLWRTVWGLESTGRQRWGDGSLLVAGTALLGITAYGLAAMRHGMSTATAAVAAGLSGGTSTGGFGAWVFVAVTLLILFASPKATSWLSRKFDDRRRAADARRAYELEHERQCVEHDRHEHAIATARLRVTETTRRRDALVVSRGELEARASEAARHERDLSEDAHRHAVAYSRALYAALEADRFAFIRRARGRGRPELIAEAPSPTLVAVPSPPAVRIAS